MSALALSGGIAAQRAVEQVYWDAREWPAQNPGPKPSLDQVEPGSLIEAKALDAVKMTNALQAYWHHTISGNDLQAEIDRQAADSRRPEMLRSLWTALGDDPLAVAETL